MQSLSASYPIAATARDGVYEMVGAAFEAPFSSILNRSVASAKEAILSSGNLSNGILPAVRKACSNGGTMTIAAKWSGFLIPIIFDDVMNLEITVSFSECQDGHVLVNGSTGIAISGAFNAPSSITMGADLAYQDLSENTDLMMASARLFLIDIGGDLSLVSATFTLSGVLSGTLRGVPVNMESRDYRVRFGLVPGGSTLSVSGQIKPVCSNTWLTLTTNTPITFLSGQICPSAGDLSATSGGNVLHVAIAGDSSIRVYFNDELVDTFANCTELTGRCR